MNGTAYQRLFMIRFYLLLKNILCSIAESSASLKLYNLFNFRRQINNLRGLLGEKVKVSEHRTLTKGLCTLYDCDSDSSYCN